MDAGKDGKKIINIDLDDSEANDSNLEYSTLQPVSGISEVNVQKSIKKISKALKELSTNDNMKFMNNFDPELSNREKRKLARKIYAEVKKNSSAYDENGILSSSEKDICDCLVEECPGCHFPCPKCRSYKCGFDCRVNRKWMYEQIENEGDKTVTKNIRTSSYCCVLHP